MPGFIGEQNGKTRQPPIETAEDTAMDVNAPPLTKACSRCRNIRPLTAFTVCRGVEVVKYITKYAYKGPDQATVQLTLTNEIQGYLEGQYVGPLEAIERLLGLQTHEEFPPVHSLIVHLPDRQPVRYPAGASADQVQSLMDGTRTQLMAYFDYKVAARREGRPTYLYNDMPRHCERFYLRLLLTVRHDAVSFEDLRTVGPEAPEPTFWDAFKKLGLLEDDSHWRATFRQAAPGSTIVAAVNSMRR
ncbi:hypothetical protein N7535_003788 [Penicillium sp. DV-2018c]|nr:hypothetical protein N7535_003788 [Penicillium sp. DV-2018c]